MINARRTFGALAVAGLIAASGSAFTTSNTLAQNNIAGYGTKAVTGATVSSMVHNLSPDGAKILTTSLDFSAPSDLSGHTVSAGFEGALVVCELDDPSVTTATCDFGTEGVATEDAENFAVAVTEKTPAV
ncbi:MAG: hypothetical protein WEB09_06980 [Nitriliruptor sp.]